MNSRLQKPLVSVVLPIYSGNSLFLERSIESILNQTFQDLELLLVIDNSDFHVGRQIRDIPRRFADDGRIRIIVNKTSGFVDALNAGIKAARGVYVARMDADDISLPNRLELQIRALEEKHLDLVGGWAFVIDEKGSIVGKLTPPASPQEIRQKIMLHNPFLHSAIVFRRSILRESGLYNRELFGAEDYDLWLRIVSLGYACMNLPNFVVLLRETRDSVMRGGKWKKTRANYARAKALGLARLGYHDPISIACCFIGPFSLLIGPKMASDLKFHLKWFSKTLSIQGSSIF